MREAASKIFIIAFINILGIAPVLAQNEEEAMLNQETNRFLPRKGDFGTSLVIEGLIDNVELESNSVLQGENDDQVSILFLKYYLKDDLALRLGFGLDIERIKNQSSDSVGINLEEVDSLTSRFSTVISLGIEKHLEASNRLDPFVYSQMDFVFIGKTKIESENKTITSNGTSSVQREITADGGIAFILSGGGGFNYFLTKNFSIGTELSLRFGIGSVGGTISDNLTVTSLNGDITTDFSKSERKINLTEVEVQPNAMINLSYFF